eukprot:CAMPEP_0184696138 /NCGR_PEP_ID=MMETSP0313-20130426/3530_1 /TAXON_ID=2792 /ORGANISM="Porphyridium aerugineum, Strain SAG 1380-2" /LENGTH=635 /DNA_ID=CAMNT_0027154707 /DNA_START=63 /DNA_END=1968 /DNA_ORIENTATION=-
MNGAKGFHDHESDSDNETWRFQDKQRNPQSPSKNDASPVSSFANGAAAHQLTASSDEEFDSEDESPDLVNTGFVGSMTSEIIEEVIELAQPKNEGKLSWVQLVFVLLSEVVGVGILSLPKCFSRLGWIPALCINTILFLATSATGVLMYNAKMKYPEVRSFPMIFGLVFDTPRPMDSPKPRVSWKMYASFMVYLLLFFYVSSDLLVQADSWQALFPWLGMRTSLFISLCVFLCILQARSFENISLVSIVGVITILVPVVLAIISLTALVKKEDAMGSHYVRGKTHLFGNNVMLAFVSTMQLLYAYSGHVVYFELLSEMKYPHEFLRSLWFAQVAIFVLYTLVGAAVYYLVGEASWLSSPFTATLPSGVLKDIVQMMIVIHSTTAGTVNCTLLIRVLQGKAEPVVKLIFHNIRKIFRSPRRRTSNSLPDQTDRLHPDPELAEADPLGNIGEMPGKNPSDKSDKVEATLSEHSPNPGLRAPGNMAAESKNDYNYSRDPHSDYSDGDSFGKLPDVSKSVSVGSTLTSGKLKRKWHPKVASADDWSLFAVLWWLVWTSIVVCFMALLLLFLPSFDNITSFSAALIATQTNLIWPALCDLKIFSPRLNIPQKLVGLLDVVLIIMGVFLLGAGIYANVVSW